MTRVASRVAGPLLVGLLLVTCGSERGQKRPATTATGNIGTCRGAVYKQQKAGRAEVDWIPLHMSLPTQLDAAFTARAIEDLGERDIYEGEDGQGVDTPRAARFTGITTLAGRVDEPVEALMSPFQLDDATTALSGGAELLVWLQPQPEDRRFASIAALEPDGDAVFLGDCIPSWTPAFDRYVERHGRGRTGAELLTGILLDPDGPDATAFRASDEGATPAGPTD